MDRSLLTKGRVEVSVPAESRRKVSNMHGYAIRAIPRGAKVERIKRGRKKKEKTNDERDRKKKTKECFARSSRPSIFIRLPEDRNFRSLQKVYTIFTNDTIRQSIDHTIRCNRGS